MDFWFTGKQKTSNMQYGMLIFCISVTMEPKLPDRTGRILVILLPGVPSTQSGTHREGASSTANWWLVEQNCQRSMMRIQSTTNTQPRHFLNTTMRRLQEAVWSVLTRSMEKNEQENKLGRIPSVRVTTKLTVAWKHLWRRLLCWLELYDFTSCNYHDLNKK